MDRVLSNVSEKLEVKNISEAYTLTSNIVLVARPVGVAFAKANNQDLHCEFIVIRYQFF